MARCQELVVFLVVFLLSLAWSPLRCQAGDVKSTTISSDATDAGDAEDADADGCEPSEADCCFSDVNENLLCHVLSNKGRNCNLRTAEDLCVSLGDALNCTSDIIDTDCAEGDGKLVFDNWLAGLRGIHKRLCLQEGYTLITDLLESTRCWNFKTFLKCVEAKANLTHINDLLTTKLDQHECNLLQMSISVCNDKAEKNGLKCRGKADAVNEAMAAFFSSSVCAREMPAACNLLKPQTSAHTSSTSTSSPTAAVFLTLLVTVIVFVLTALILVWRNVISINARFGIQRSNVDCVEDSREDYGRFL